VARLGVAAFDGRLLCDVIRGESVQQQVEVLSCRCGGLLSD
jgi:hypothetical protein